MGRNAELDDPNVIAGLAKGLAVIEAFDAMHARLSIADVARRVGLERATARRCLLTLVHLGYAQFDGKFFSLAPRIMRLGYAFVASTPLPRVVEPFLERLAETTGESCSASILDGHEIVYIARAAQRRVMSINLFVGSRLPAYCSSMGRVLLAAETSERAREILERSERRALTEHTLTKLPALMAEIDRVRKNGFAVINEELELGLRSIAVPVLGVSGKPIAALNVGAQAARVSATRLQREILPQLLAVQQELRPLIGAGVA